MNDTDQDFVEAFRKTVSNSRLPKEEAWRRAFLATCLAFSQHDEIDFLKCIAAIYIAEGVGQKIGFADPTKETRH
jgi:hypothetical protein